MLPTHLLANKINQLSGNTTALLLSTDFIRRAVVTDQTLVAVATGDVSFAGAVATDLVTRSAHHDDATRVTAAS